MDVTVADHGPPVGARPLDRARVEVHMRRDHPVVFDGVEEAGVALELAPQAGPRREKRMRRDDQAALDGLQLREIREGMDLFRCGAEVDQQHVLAFDPLLDSRNQRQAAAGGIRPDPGEIELAFVKGDGHRAKPERRGAVNQVGGGVRDAVDRVVAGMNM